MIQLGSILAVVWLYRAKIINVVAGLATQPGGAAFRRGDRRRHDSGACRRRALRRFRQVASSIRARACLPVAFIVGGIVMLLVERLRPAPVVDATPSDTPLPRAFGVGVVPDARAGPRRVAVGRDDHRRDCDAARAARRPRSSRSSWRSRRCRRRSRTSLLEVRGSAVDRRAALEIAVGLVDGVPLVAAHHQAVSRVRAARRGSRRSRGIASRSASALLAAIGGRVGARMMSWLRRRFVTGFFVLVPLVISIVALIWVFGVVDGFTAPLYERYFKRVPRHRRAARAWASSRRRC